MSTLTLVRHGQASFFADDYDRLSETGRTQARLLGEFWARDGRPIDAVYTGPRLRQRQTAEIAGSAFAQGGLAWPTPVVLDELDEYDLEGLLRQLVPALAQQHPPFADLHHRYLGSRDTTDEPRAFQRMFEALTRHWQDEAVPVTGLEAWPKFTARVGRGIARMTERHSQGQRVVAFTSGGFIGAAVQRVLGAPERIALELSWRLRNGALTDLLFTRDRCSLDVFNTLPYLDDRALWTYR